jgi:hypothetical protein
MADGNQRRWEKTRAAKLALIEAVKSGKARSEAMAELDILPSRLQGWRQNDPEFRDRLAHAENATRHLHTSRLDTLGSIVAQVGGPGYTEGVPGDFGGFVGKFFPDRRPHLPHQLALVRELGNLKPREVVLFLLWPESGKSSTLEDYMCRKLALAPDHRFRIVSASGAHAERMIGFCKRRFTDTSEWPEFIGRFGPFYEKNQERAGRPWGAEQITVMKATSTERDRSIVATGWSGKTTGSRIDTLIFDDVQIPENYNEAEKIFRRLRSTFFTRQRDMRTLIIGHRIGPGDIYDRMMDAGLISRQVILPAAGGWGAEPGQPTVPEFWADSGLVHDRSVCCGGLVQFRDCPNNGEPLSAVEYMELFRHQVGEDTWHAMYLQDPTSDELTSFSAYVDACFDHDRTIGPLVGV